MRSIRQMDDPFTMKTEIKDISYYQALPYATILRRDEDGYIIAQIVELQGCVAHGKDEVEALSNLADMKRLWLEDAMTAGDSIPEPQPEEPLPSGKWVQRVPRSLHHKLTKMALQEGVSLNQLVTAMLAECFGSLARSRRRRRKVSRANPAQPRRA